MRKVVIHRAGGPGKLALEDHPTPIPSAGEVLVDVEAAGVNFADVAVRLGLYKSAKTYIGWPITPGFEVAGRVRALGRGIRDLEVGAPVIAATRFGGYASAVSVPRARVLERPEGMTATDAAGFPVVGLTAYYALFELCRPRPGNRVLVHSAAGGVGGALLQLARIAGCEPIAVVGSTKKVEHARRLGAAAVIDRSKEDLWRAAERHAPRGYDVILDAVGPATLRQSYRHLAPTGRLIVYGFASMLSRGGSGRRNPLRLLHGWLVLPRFSPLRMTNENRSVLAFNLSFLFDRTDLFEEAMQRLLGWRAEGALALPSPTPYPLDRVADAHRDLESGETTGKLVLVPGAA